MSSDNTTTVTVAYKAWWKTDYTYTNKDTGNFFSGDNAVFSDNGWYLHVLPGAIAGLLAIIFVVFTYNEISNYEVKNKAVRDLGKIINQGAKDFLTAEYKWLGVFVAVIFVVLS